MIRYSPHDKIREIERELFQRERVYPRLIDSGKMTPDKASRQIMILRSILEDYQRCVPGDLFLDDGRK